MEAIYILTVLQNILIYLIKCCTKAATEYSSESIAIA